MTRAALVASIGCMMVLAAVPALGATDEEGHAPAAGLPEGAVPDEIVLSFRGAIPPDVASWLAAHGGSLLLRDDVLHWVSARFVDREAADRALEAAKMRADVRAATHDAYVALLFTPNDPQYGSQWGYPALQAPAAWDLTLGSHAVKVAVLDTGIQTTHPDLAANACGPFASFVPGEPTIADGHGHGTHVSGTIAAVSNNGLGVAGTSQSCLMGAKVLNSGGAGQLSWVAAGIRWAADNGAHVISMSLGGGLGSPVLSDAVFYANVLKGVLVVAAAGNSGCGVPQTMLWPAMYNEVMAVAALAPPGNAAAGFSSCGAKVEIAAPGQGVRSTFKGSSYATLSGTSMATPHIAGVAALLKAAHPDLGAAALRCLLDLSADDLTQVPGRDITTGWGRADARAAMDLAAQLKAQGLDATAIGALCTALIPGLGWGGEPSAPLPIALPEQSDLDTDIPIPWPDVPEPPVPVPDIHCPSVPCYPAPLPPLPPLPPL